MVGCRACEKSKTPGNFETTVKVNLNKHNTAGVKPQKIENSEGEIIKQKKTQETDVDWV